MSLSRTGWLLSATFLVIANMIGTGIYTTTGFIVAELPAGVGVLFLWMLGGVAALGGALAYAELAKRYPRSGGEYHFLRTLYHPFLGYLAGMVSLVAGFAAPIAASAYTFAAYLPLPLSEIERKLAAAGLVLALIGVHTLGLTRSARIQNVFVILKISLLVSLILGALFFVGEPQELTCPRWSWDTLQVSATSLIFISFAYSGWNAAAYIMSEIPEATRIVPKAIIIGTLSVMGLYVAFNWALLRYVPLEELSGETVVGRLLAKRLWGEVGEAIFGWGVSIAMVSSVSAMLMIAPRVASVMGEDFALLRTLSQRTQRGVPLRALVGVGLLAWIFIFSAAFDAVLNYIGFTLSLFAGLTVLGLFLRHYREKGLPWDVGIVFLSLTAWMVINNFWSRPWESVAGVITLIAIGSSYLWARR
ncbi:MAG: amino acid permease [Bacteroidia bacterium]|nr:amino acid permease [Bacteroidia bacterium]MCX7764997.1 amino acid permease [Bacteroidia bacterium]MDW8057849.1 amino acid permease [Bacteroidia bacterium]